MGFFCARHNTKDIAKDITVRVTEGVVTLAGTVTDEPTLHAIHELAVNTDCVHRIDNQLRLKAAQP